MSVAVMERVSTVSIYALADPNGEVRYVGKTTSPLERRLAAHLWVARHNPSTYVGKWIGSLLAAGETPTIMLLEEVGDDWADVERYWIRQLRLMGCRLANTSDGGEGGATGWKATPETRARMSAAAKGKPKSPEHVEAVRKALTGRKGANVGEKNGFARFTETQVVAIRERHDAGETLSSLAAEFGTSKAQCSLIVTGQTWKHVGGPIRAVKPRAKLTKEQVAEIRGLLKDGVPQGDIARRYGVSQPHVNDIHSRRRWLT